MPAQDLISRSGAQPLRDGGSGLTQARVSTWERRQLWSTYFILSEIPQALNKLNVFFYQGPPIRTNRKKGGGLTQIKHILSMGWSAY